MLEEDLTPGERLRLFRRRRGWVAPDMAAFLGVDIDTYHGWEKDLSSETAAPDVELGGMEPYEHYFMLRYRSGITAKELGMMIGRSKEWVLRSESGLCPLKPLIEFWGH